MVEWKKVSRRKSTGGINNAVNAKTKTLSEKGGKFAKTTVAKVDKRFKSRTVGGNEKTKISHAQTVLVSEGNKTIKGRILDVTENPANKHFVRQKIITKGAILKVDLNGKETKVKVTSRPGQDGLVSGVIVK
ncbi:MAG TPA: 30S ribosomal protein S8e [archaeon]|jgi:small subunit ribosomal protein S8e|nr:30S ribosomal protein S8e [archaeon]